ncbi:MAG: [Fe-Fe] hydrogenase large subunit C-terminal domain-containing protein [Bacillota bacterium]
MAAKHSVLLKEDKCEGCTNCVKKCPTRAIRVHKGRAWIKEDLCIDCAECIRTCEYHAKYTETDKLDDIKKYDYPVLIIPPSFYGQFGAEIPASKIKAAVLKLGFKKVVDVAESAAALSRKTLEFLENNSGSYISASCPVIIRLIKLLYPDLIEMIIPFKSPVELCAEKTDKILREEENIRADIFLLTPCPAKLTTIKYPLGQEKSFLTGAVGVENVYQKIYDKVSEITEKEAEQFSEFSPATIWGQEGGETDILNRWRAVSTITVSGIHQVKKILDEIERNNISSDVKYFELTSCIDGCVGGVLNVVNPFQAGFNLQKRMEKVSQLDKEDKNDFIYDFLMTKKIKADDVGKLDPDFNKAMAKLEQMEKEIERLPGLDCAACGAPDCRTFAEDIVNGLANRSDCIFMLRKNVGQLADKLSELAHELPPVMSSEKEENDESKRSD